MVKQRINKVVALLLLLLILVLVNVLGSLKFFRIDLTSESRYSLTPSTISLLDNMEDEVFIRTYLDGDLPVEMRRLRTAVEEMLEEFRAYGGGKIRYEFVDPSSGEEKDKVSLYKDLQDRGLRYTNLQIKKSGGQSQQVVFPGALVRLGDKEIAVNFLKSMVGAPPEVALHHSIQELEYGFAWAIQQVTTDEKVKIGWLRGHGELNGLEVADVERLLTASYDVSPVVLEGKFDALDGYEALIVAGPTESFARQDQFVIDQFIMRGGKVLWFLEGTTATMDSIGDPNYMALGQDQTIHQQIFKYGVRLNPDLVMDQLSRMIGLNVAPYGQDPDIRGFLWPYAPMLAPASEHPIVKNSDALVTSFVSTLDTLKREGVEHTLLMHSSPRSRVVKMPHRVSFDLLNMEQDLRQYNAGAKTVAVLSEGVFTSYFTNSSEAAKVSQIPGLTFLSASAPTKMVVCADADVLKNPVNYAAKQYLPLGHDRYTGRTFGNADFLMNMLNYLCEDGQLIDARNKDFKMRMMDPQRIQTEAVIWQFVNVGGPVLILILFGVGQFIIRKRKYAR